MLHNKYTRRNLVKKSLIFGEPDYFKNIRSRIIPFITSRVVPFAGFTLITVMIARLNYPELGTFTYLTAMFSLPVVLMSMPLAMVGNFSAASKKTGESGSEIFLSGLRWLSSCRFRRVHCCIHAVLLSQHGRSKC